MIKEVTYSEVQDLVKRLPEAKLSLAYNLLTELVEDETEELSPQEKFMRLPLVERRRLLAQQAQEAKRYYEETAAEREEWQGGDFIEQS